MERLGYGRSAADETLSARRCGEASSLAFVDPHCFDDCRLLSRAVPLDPSTGVGVNLKSPLRRTAAVAAGALVGLVGVVALAGPASAHHPILNPSSPCVNADGTWQVTWTVGNSEDIPGVLTEVTKTPENSQLTGIGAQSALLPRDQTELEGVQTLAAGDESANIKVTAEWHRGDQTHVQSATLENPIKKPTEKCKPTTNPSPTPSTSASTPSEPEPSTPASDEPSTPVSDEPSTPSSDEPSAPPAKITEPEFVYDEDCDSVSVGITVPKDWDKGDITVKFTTSEGESKTIVGKVGKTTTVEFKAVNGMKIVAAPQGEGYEDEGATITYKTPADCDSAGGGAGEPDEPTLPLTGAAAGSIAGGAALLLAVGAGLFFMARRRKVKFTA
jgi:LPXTG-motif cell wall-anchored protein